MALVDLLAQLNVVDCEGKAVGATGLAGCPFDWDRIETIELSQPSFRYEEAQDLDYIQAQQALGNLIIVKGFESFANVTPDPNINTVDGSGFKTVTGEMPYEFTGTINNGVVAWQGMRTLNGKDRWNVAFYDVEGNKIFTQTKAGAVKGFGVKMFFIGAYRGKEGNNPAVQTLMLQLSDYRELDRQTWIAGENLDFDPSDIDGINGVLLTANPVENGATNLTFTAKLQDRTHDVEGLLVTDFEFTKNGQPITPSLLAYANGVYTATVPAVATGEVYTINLPNTFVSGVGYRSVSIATVVVIA
jgi:hypothetical protein